MNFKAKLISSVLVLVLVSVFSQSQNTFANGFESGNVQVQSLNYTKTNGSTSPHLRRAVSCQIYLDPLLGPFSITNILETRGNEIVRDVKLPVVWTKEIKNAEIALMYSLQVRNEKSETFPGLALIGGSVENFFVTYYLPQFVNTDKSPFEVSDSLYKSVGSKLVKAMGSKEAKALANFISKNCLGSELSN